MNEAQCDTPIKCASGSGAGAFVPSAVRSIRLENRDTDISFMNFEDKLFVVISQFKKIGTLVLVTKDTAACGEIQEAVYTTKVLLGRDEAEVHAAARHIATKMQCPKTLLLGLALKEISPATVRSAADALAVELASLWPSGQGP
ncbi:proteasome assembly chaperone 3-like [Haemaphysalis longicornis]